MSYWVTVFMAGTRNTPPTTSDWGPLQSHEQAAEVMKGLSRRRGVTQVIIEERGDDE